MIARAMGKILAVRSGQGGVTDKNADATRPILTP
jgi:hypothetical protein